MIIQKFLGRIINSYFLNREITHYTKYYENSYNSIIEIKKTDKLSHRSILNIVSTNEMFLNMIK